MRRTWVLFGLVGLACAGCSSTRPPGLTIQSAELTEQTDAGMVVTFTVLADNPNPDALPLRDAQYTVSLAGKPVFSGVRSAQATVRRFGTQTFTLPAAIPASPAGRGVEPFEISGKLTYLVPGALAETLFDIHVLRPSTSFGGKGDVDLSRLTPPTKPQAPEAAPQAGPDAPGPSPD